MSLCADAKTSQAKIRVCVLLQTVLKVYNCFSECIDLNKSNLGELKVGDPDL